MTQPKFVAGAVDLGQLKKPAAAARGALENGAEGAPAIPALTALSTPERFEDDLVVPSTKVLVVALCGSSRAEQIVQMRADFERMANMQDVREPEQVKWLFRYVDVDTHPEIAQAFGVQQIPTTIALAAGRPLTQFEGVEPIDQLSTWLGTLLQAVEGKLPGFTSEAPVDPRMDEAAALVDAGDIAGAIALYDQVLAEHPRDSEATAARAQAVLLMRLQETSQEDAQGPLAQADRLMIEGNAAAAFAVLLDEVRSGPGERREAAKARLFELFGMFESDNPDVIHARTQLAMALF